MNVNYELRIDRHTFQSRLQTEEDEYIDWWVKVFVGKQLFYKFCDDRRGFLLSAERNTDPFITLWVHLSGCTKGLCSTPLGLGGEGGGGN